MDQDHSNESWLECPSGEKRVLSKVCVIGRSAKCDIVLASEKVSRRHAMINCHGAREFWLVDLGSANGTRLNGNHVTDPLKLYNEDTIEVAEFIIRFKSSSQRPFPTLDSATVNSTVHDLRTVECWLLVTDIVDSTRIVGKLTPEQAAAQLGAWLEACKRIVETHHGVVNKFLGDGLFAYWRRTEGSISEMTGLIHQFKAFVGESPVPFRVVLHHGAATIGGVPALREESLTGNAVNFVFRMESLASALGCSVLISQSAAEKLKRHTSVESLGSHRVSGFEGVSEFFTV
jgi:class 3 adenylate cyclase